MKILITGYTTRMWGSPRVQGDYVTFSTILPDILREMGHEVEKRIVPVGEDIRYVYHYAFCGVAPLSSITSAKVPETHYVMDQMTRKHAIFADDWSFCGFGDSVRYALVRWSKYLGYKNFIQTDEMLEQTRISLENMMNTPLAGNNAPVLAPMFPWGDHDFLMRGNYFANLTTIDPSAWVKYPTIHTWSASQRKKEWLMAALSDHSPWVRRQRFSFPVTYIGNKRKNYVLTEDQTVQEFAKYFGVLSTGYPSAGSGWWRTRYLNAAWAETPVYSDPNDQIIMGESYQGTPAQFESEYGSLDYTRRIIAQRDWLNSHVSKKEEVFETIERLLKS